MDLKNKRVIIRVDFNVPFKDGIITDDSRIKSTLPTLKYILDQKAKLIIMFHLGRPSGRVVEKLRADFVAERLKELLKCNVKKVNSSIGPEVETAVHEMNFGDVVVLENIRFCKEEKENNEAFAKKLSQFADVYVNDAFGVSHRAHASVEAIQHYLPSCAGLLLDKEIQMLGKVKNPEKPFVAIIGGAKADKIDVIEALLPKIDKLIIGGVLANTFLKAQGADIKASRFDEETLQMAKKLLANQDFAKKMVLPTDLSAASEFSNDADVKIVNISDIPDNYMALDIGPETIRTYTEILKQARTILWAGPIGVFEFANFSLGTKEVAFTMAESSAVTIIGGGDSASAIHHFGLDEKMTHISTGGGASLKFISGKSMPGIEALEKSAVNQEKK